MEAFNEFKEKFLTCLPDPKVIEPVIGKVDQAMIDARPAKVLLIEIVLIAALNDVDSEKSLVDQTLISEQAFLASNPCGVTELQVQPVILSTLKTRV